MLTRDEILGADDLPRERVEVPEWGGCVYVRTMTGAERDAFEAGIAETREKTGEWILRARLAALTIVDEGGKPLFAESDITVLQGKSCAALDRIFEAADRLNHITGRDIAELAKNSGSGQSAASTSD